MWSSWSRTHPNWRQHFPNPDFDPDEIPLGTPVPQLLDFCSSYHLSLQLGGLKSLLGAPFGGGESFIKPHAVVKVDKLLKGISNLHGL